MANAEQLLRRRFGFDLRDRRVTVYASPRLIVQYKTDRRGIAKIAVGQPLRDATRSAVVNRAMVHAIQISPRGATLEYVSSWRAADGFTVVAGMRRAACKLINVAPHAAAVEWGRGGNQRILGKTLAWLNSTSPMGVERAARAAARAPWKPELHPRGPGGRFAPTVASLRRRAERAAQIQSGG
jgi:hypothetical protein